MIGSNSLWLRASNTLWIFKDEHLKRKKKWQKKWECCQVLIHVLQRIHLHNNVVSLWTKCTHIHVSKVLDESFSITLFSLVWGRGREGGGGGGASLWMFIIFFFHIQRKSTKCLNYFWTSSSNNLGLQMLVHLTRDVSMAMGFRQPCFSEFGFLKPHFSGTS